MMTSCYHDGGIDEHGVAAIHKGRDYGKWANATHARGAQMKFHNITTYICEIDSNTAHAESSFWQDSSTLTGSRCASSMGVTSIGWKSATVSGRFRCRRCTLDFRLLGQSPYIRQAGYKPGNELLAVDFILSAIAQRVGNSRLHGED